MSDLISREYMKSLGGACIARRLKDGDLCPIISIDLLPSAQPERMTMMMESFEKNQWIPVTEKLPDDQGMVLVSCRNKKGLNSINRAYYWNGYWHGSGSMSGVKAWKPLPKVYGGE